MREKWPQEPTLLAAEKPISLEGEQGRQPGRPCASTSVRNFLLVEFCFEGEVLDTCQFVLHGLPKQLLLVDNRSFSIRSWSTSRDHIGERRRGAEGRKRIFVIDQTTFQLVPRKRGRGRRCSRLSRSHFPLDGRGSHHILGVVEPRLRVPVRVVGGLAREVHPLALERG